MRISRIRIDSYGRLKDRDIDVSEGLNVFYGPNESGKTTVMEFVRNTLVPTSRRSGYPEKNKTDSGSVVVIEDGREYVIGLGAKSEVPESLQNVDSDVYRNIFALNQSGLDNLDAISGDDIRSKFLTIPGGENVPDAIKSLDTEIKDSLGSTSRSPSRINTIQQEQNGLDSDILSMRVGAESYSTLVESKAELESEKAKLEEGNKSVYENNELYARVQSVKPMFEKLSILEKKKVEADRAGFISDEDKRTRELLKNERDQKKYAFDKRSETLRELQSQLPCEEEQVRASEPSICSIIERWPDLHKTVQTVKPIEQKPGRAKYIIPAVLAICAIAVLLIPGIDFLYKGIGAAILFIIAILFLVMSNKKPSSAFVPVDDPNEGYKRELDALLYSLGMKPTTVEMDLKRLTSVKEKYRAIVSTREDCKNLNLDYMAADNRYIKFLSQFGGEQGYRAALQNTATSSEIDSSISTVRENIVGSGFDPDKPLPVVEHIDVDDSRMSEINREIGSLNVQIKAALDTTKLDELLDRKARLEAEKVDVLREAAVTLLSSYIVDEACAELYQDVHPDVIQTADHYLSLMTSGKYRIDTDPRRTEISVRSEEGSKGPKQWSTGLRAQVLLSLKMAVAKEMGNGRIPMILDDVLLPFDKDRKAGACRALAHISEEMQVLLFTCDDAIYRTMSEVDGCNVVLMAGSDRNTVKNVCTVV